MAVTVKYSLTAEDVLASHTEAVKLMPSYASERRFYRGQLRAWCVILGVFGVAFAAAMYWMFGARPFVAAPMLGCLAVLCVVTAIKTAMQSYEGAVSAGFRRHAMSGALDLMPGAYEMTCDEKGLRVVGPWSDAWMDWKTVHGVTRGERFVIVMKREGAYYAVPVGAVEGEFVGRVEGWRRGHEGVGQ